MAATLFLLLLLCIVQTLSVKGQLSESEVASKSLDYLRGTKDLSLPLKWLKGIIEKATVAPLIQPIAVFIARTVVVSFILGEMLSYMGFIGERGEGLYDWAVQNHVEINGFMRKWGSRPGGWVRHRLYKVLSSYKRMSAKAKFVSSVSTGVTFFPLCLKTTVWATAASFVLYGLAELMSLLGIIGDPGEPLAEFVKHGEREPIIRTFKRISAEVRVILRRKLKVHELIVGFVRSVKHDNVFWLGFLIGGGASILLPIYFD